MEELGRKIKELRLRRGMTLKQVADAIGKTPAYISIIENKKKKLRRKLLEDIAAALDTDIAYFLGPEKTLDEKGPILKELKELIERHTVDGASQTRGGRRVPILSDIAAGVPISRDDPFPVGVADEFVEVPSDITDPHAFGLRIKGDSMEPRLFDRDVVVVCPSWKVKENRPVVAKVNDDEVTCKIFSRTEELIVLTSINTRYPPQIYNESEIVWIYPVARAISNLYT